MPASFLIQIGLAATLLMAFPGAAETTAQRRQAFESEPGKLVGMIVDGNEARIATARVLITNRRIKREIAVDEEGYFQISLPGGWYRVTISAPGFQTARKNVFVKSNAIVALNIKLPVAVYSSH